MQYNEVVVDHMTMKEKQKRKEEQEAREGRAATKVGPRVIVTGDGARLATELPIC